MFVDAAQRGGCKRVSVDIVVDALDAGDGTLLQLLELVAADAEVFEHGHEGSVRGL